MLGLNWHIKNQINTQPKLLGFEFVMLANHDKTWQKLSLISLEWSTLKPKTKNSILGWKQVIYNLVGSIDPKTDSIDPKSHISKINKRKKAITYSFEAQIASRFFQYLKDIIS